MTKRCGAYGVAALLVCGAAQATSFNHAWSEFERRCLLPFEDFAPAVVADLVPVPDQTGAYQLPSGARLVISGADAQGSRSCAIEGAELQRGFQAWMANVTQSDLYREGGTAGVWMSHEWIEPRIIVEKEPNAVRVVESYLES